MVLLHMGVDGTRPTFNLEQVAQNCAHFRCADEDGWLACNEPIEWPSGASGGASAAEVLPGQLGGGAQLGPRELQQAQSRQRQQQLPPLPGPRQSDLPLAEVRERLMKRGFTVNVSHDAGRFVCNYTLYRR